jgi:integrase
MRRVLPRRWPGGGFGGYSDDRQGFFEREQFAAVRKYLSEDLQVAATVAYTFGWRIQSEVLTLERRQLDLGAETLRLDPGTTKNDDGRLVYLTPELKTLLSAQVERVKALERKLGRIIPYLFPHLPAPHVSSRLVGTQRRDFRKAWVTACKLAGVRGANAILTRRVTIAVTIDG